MSKRIVFNLKTRSFSEEDYELTNNIVKTGFIDFGKKVRLTDVYFDLVTVNKEDKYGFALKTLDNKEFSIESNYRKLNLPKGIKSRYFMFCLHLPDLAKLFQLKFNVMSPDRNV